MRYQSPDEDSARWDGFPFRQGDMVLSTIMEHHSNDLPWRRRAQVLRAGITADGRLDGMTLTACSRNTEIELHW